MLAGSELRDTIRRALRTWRDARRSRAARLAAGAGRNALLDRLLPVRILKLAREQHGVLTVALVAMELNVPLDQAQAGLDECVRAGNALPDYDIARGHALYRFPEFAGPDRRPRFPIDSPALHPPAKIDSSWFPAPVAQLDRATVS